MSYALSLLLTAAISKHQLPTPALPPVEMCAKTTLNRLGETEIQQRMPSLPKWTTDGQSLFYTGKFANFVEAIEFVNSLVAPAEMLAHHPDITIHYNQVFLELTTHDAQGLTELDFLLATQISQL